MSIWCVLSCLGLAACQTPRRPTETEFVRRTQPLLGTFFVVAAYGTNRAVLNDAISAAFEEVRRIDALLSIHRSDSELSRVNARAAAGPVPVSRELFGVVALAQEIARETEGSFDVTIRPIADLWGFIWKEHRLPAAEELSDVLPRVNYHWILLDATNQTIRFATNGVSIDPGGIGKGYAVDRAIERLRAFGVSNALVRAGGDLRVIGTPPGQRAWEVQIEDPAKTGERTTILLRDAAVSTSGNYENFFVVNGRRYAHILNPRTGLPVQGIASCSVIAPTCAVSDAWATALFVYGAERSVQRFARRFPMRFVLVDEDGKLRVRESRFPVSPRRADEQGDHNSLK